jgi:hypothetical protein
MAEKRHNDNPAPVAMAKDGRTVQVKPMHVPAWRMMGYSEQGGTDAAVVVETKEEVAQ